MVFNSKNIVAYLIASSASFSATGAAVAKSRDLTVCDTLKACFLVNIQTRQETELSGNDSFELDPLNKHGYSICCDVNGKDSLDFIKFFYDGMVQEEFGEPRYMDGDSDEGKYINAVKYLSTCGPKTLKIAGSVWSNPCFEKEFMIDVLNAGGKPCASSDTAAPVKPPTAAPLKPPTNAPVKPPTAAPLKPPTNAPVKPPTAAPLKPPTNAPVKPPTNAPVKPPTNAPVKPPTRAPVKPPTRSPVKPPTRAPVKPPTRAPVKPPTRAPVKVCTFPEVLINGECKNTCKNDYVCPSNSYRKPNIVCYDSFEDCECKNGFFRATSEAKCSCPSPKVLINGECKENTCKNDYHCPTNSFRKPNMMCYDSFDDCECKNGFVRAMNEAKCACPSPKVLVNGECKENTCKNDYHCPSNSYRKPNMMCYDSFDDCECKNGFVKASHDDKCWCPSPKVLVNGECKDNTCKNSYVCPANSYRKPNMACYDCFEDCECKHGYYKSSHEEKCLRHIWCTW